MRYWSVRTFLWKSFPLFISIISISACAPARMPVPPGEIPVARPVTSAEEQYGHSILQSLSEQYPLEYNDPALDRIQKIVDRLTAAASADDQPWHVFLFRADHVVNAAATRGNHLFVWSGLINTVQNDDELAVILAHELAHVLAGHTDPDPNEELKRILISVGALAAGIAVTASTSSPSLSVDFGNLTTGLTQQIGQGLLLNPYTRELEIEADTVGLMLMAEAKYDPNAAITFWTRAGSHPDFRTGIEFLSTHPPTEERLANVNRMMELAMQRYRGEKADPIASTARPHLAMDPTSEKKSSVATSIPGDPVLTFDPNDSFDLSKHEAGATQKQFESKPPEARVKLVPMDSQSVQSHGENRWLIVTPYADIYAKPSFKSDRVGRIGHGDRFTVEASEGEWVRVSEPRPGYIRMVEARPLSAATP